MNRYTFSSGSIWSRIRAAAGSLFALSLASCVLVAFLSGCGSTQAPVAKADEAAVARYRAAGYPLPASIATEAHRISGPVTEAPWTIGVTRPADHLVHPVIIYLPGLGQDESTPVRWVESWAHAGYAVLVIQTLRDDANVWSTADARSGDFERIARARFSDDLMADRLDRLSRLLTQIRARSLRGEAGLEGLDWNHLAMAGADLGAYTVQCIASSTPAALAALQWPLAPQAYLMISPYAVRSASGTAAIADRAPVLMISSRDDVDAYGVVTDPSIRHLAFDRMVGGDSTYFELGSATHRWLAGAVVSSAAAEAAPRPRMMFDEGEHGSPVGRRGKQGSGRDDMAPESEDEESATDRKARVASVADQTAARSRTLTQSALSVASFEAVSVAYLDAWVRNQSAARTWLNEGAPLWLQNGDRLKHR